MNPLNILIIEKNATIKALSIKNFKIDELYKKCGFKKSENFIKQVDWSTKYEGKKINIEVFAKTDGRANSENKYDFPPPIDKLLFFGSCSILAYKTLDGKKQYINLSVTMWNKIYEKLFGGFEDLSSTMIEDEEEEDELENIPQKYKTKQGYLKDGFVVDNCDDETTSEYTDDDEETEELTQEGVLIEDCGSELSEELYDYEKK
jgi:hypothetical protein